MKLGWYDWIVINTSAGKDSQAMLDYVVKLAEREGVKDRVVAVHADLSEEEWPGTKELAGEQAAHYGIRFEVVKRPQGGILQHVLVRHATLLAAGKHTPPWPSNTARWCTSEHKRGQVKKLFTRLARESRQQKGESHRTAILNCMGMRAAESCNRSKLVPFSLDAANSNGRRLVQVWLPIHAWSADMVWSRIRAAGTRSHYAYSLGMGRLSCCLCIFSPRSALLLAGKHNRELLDRYCQVEEQTGFAFRKELPLVSIREALDRGEEPGPVTSWEMP